MRCRTNAYAGSIMHELTIDCGMRTHTSNLQASIIFPSLMCQPHEHEDYHNNIIGGPVLKYLCRCSKTTPAVYVWDIFQECNSQGFSLMLTSGKTRTGMGTGKFRVKLGWGRGPWKNFSTSVKIGVVFLEWNITFIAHNLLLVCTCYNWRLTAFSNKP